MVKNFGGNKSKKLARKVISAPRDNRLRTPDPNQPDEQLACVSKMLGNGMCQVECGDNKTRICIIRNKFRGRSKRDNAISGGSFVLVDVRSWETAATSKSKLEKCDLLEVYNPGEMERLKDTVSFDWNKFKGIGTHTNEEEIDDNGEFSFEFNDNNTTELENNINKKIETTTILEDYEDEIDIDDI